MNKMFDSVNDAFRTAFDAGRRTQETWFKAGRDAWQQPGDFNRMFNFSEQVAREWMPVMQKNAEAAANLFGANFRAGMDMVQATCDMGSTPDNGNLYEKTRKMWDTAFDVARANMDFVTKTTTRTIENCAAFCDAFRPADIMPGKTEPTTRASEGGKNRP
jgi:hypothetical protein